MAACVFVDGENFRHSLKNLFNGGKYTFKQHDYLPAAQFGGEKGIDTRMATDMIELANIYDAAIILSGDADYLPPVAAVKRKGQMFPEQAASATENDF